MKTFTILAIAVLLAGCSTVQKELLKIEEIAERFELAEGRIGTSGHTISGEVRVTGSLDELGEYQLTSLDGRITNAVTGRSIYIEGSRVEK